MAMTRTEQIVDLERELESVEQERGVWGDHRSARQ